MSGKFIKTKPSFLEAGLPCSPLSAECQRDNSAASRPPQNTLHIWWARRAPTICRAAIISALLPHDLRLSLSALHKDVAEPEVLDTESLPKRLRPYQDWLRSLLEEIPETVVTPAHAAFLRSLGITGDVARAYARICAANEHVPPLILGNEFGYRHPPAFRTNPKPSLLISLLEQIRANCALEDNAQVIVLDPMAGGGSIPLEGVRYGFKVYANDLNPVASLVLKATIEYPARFSNSLLPQLASLCNTLNEAIQARLREFFWSEPAATWWPEMSRKATAKFRSSQVERVEPADEARTRFFLWLRTLPCPACKLNIPLSTNLTVSAKGSANEHLAAFPVVPPRHKGNDCTFEIVAKPEWATRSFSVPGFEAWDPRGTPTFRDGQATCPRCGRTQVGDEVKAYARSQGDSGGLKTQMYAVCSQVPVKVTYRNGETKIRYLWRFRAPTAADLQAVQKAEAELTRLRPKWTAQDLLPNEEVPEDMEDRRPREYGMRFWWGFFQPRQLLTNVVVLDEIRKALDHIRLELPSEQIEALAVYLAFALSKIVNHNSVNTFWHYGHNKNTQSFSRHDFAFRPAFVEMSGEDSIFAWAERQIRESYLAIASLVHAYSDDIDRCRGESLTAELEQDLEEEEEEEREEHQEGPTGRRPELIPNRQDVIVPTVTCDDAAALSVPAPGSVHLICVDPPYYNNVQYSELSNFFYVWLKRVLRDFDGLAPLFREPLAETNREAVANAARWKREEEEEQVRWQGRYDEAFQRLRGQGVKVKDAKAAAEEAAGTKPLTAAQRADRFYEDKMSAVFRRARQLLHPAGRMVVMFNHKMTAAWSSRGMALTRAGFEVRSSVPIHTEAESSLNIRGLDAARSTVLLMCVPREEREQPEGNWSTVQKRVNHVARAAAQRFQGQGLSGTDLYLSAWGPALGEVGRNWPVTTLAGREVDLEDALEEAYKAVGAWRLEQILASLTERAKADELLRDFTAESVDKNTQTLWLWLDTFQGEVAGTDDVRRLAKSLNVEPDAFKRLGLLKVEKDTFVLQSPSSLDLRRLARQLRGEETGRGRAARAADAWEERVFPEFLGAAVWNAIGLMLGAEEGARGPESLKRWLRESGYGSERDFRGAFLVTLHLLEAAFRNRREDDEWLAATTQARRAWDLVMQNGRR